jgi:hypothetical protein
MGSVASSPAMMFSAAVVPNDADPTNKVPPSPPSASRKNLQTGIFATTKGERRTGKKSQYIFK